MGLQSRRRGKALLLVLCIGMAALLLAGFRSGTDQDAVKASVAANKVHSGNDGVEQGLDLLAAAGRKITEADSALRLVLKYQGAYSGNSAESAEAAAALAEHLGLGRLERSEEDGHVTYRASAPLSTTGKASMLWSALDHESSYVIVTLETADLLKEASFRAAVKEAAKRMEDAGIGPEWNASLQGIAAGQDSPRETLLYAEQSIAAEISGLQAVEDYTDETTYSRSYSAPGLARYVQSGDHAVAMQTAVHRDGNTGKNRVTVGLPLITIEY